MIKRKKNLIKITIRGLLNQKNKFKTQLNIIIKKNKNKLIKSIKIQYKLIIHKLGKKKN